jgi:hypothetical protein
LARYRCWSALDELQAKADALHKSDKSLTKEQAFAKVFADPANAELPWVRAARE